MEKADAISSLQCQVNELQERVEKLENAETHENKGINDKLSNYTYKIIQDSKGPLTPDELVKHFMDDGFAKNKKDSLAIIRKFPNNYDKVRNQFSHILETIENRIAFRKKENELDDKLVKKIRKINKTLEEEQEKEMKSKGKPKIQSTMDQFFDKEPHNGSTRNKKASSKGEFVGKSKASKRRMRVKEANKENMKRKNRNDDEDDESCSSQEIEVEQITSSYKRFKLNSPQESIESNVEEESDMFSQIRDSRPIISSQSSSEGSQSDVISEDDSTGIINKMKSDVKSAGKRTKQLGSRSKENAPEYNGNEETVCEKRLPLRGKQIR